MTFALVVPIVEAAARPTDQGLLVGLLYAPRAEYPRAFTARQWECLGQRMVDAWLFSRFAV